MSFQRVGTVADDGPETLEEYKARKAREHAEIRADLIRAGQQRFLERIRRESELGERFQGRRFSTWHASAATERALAAAMAAVDDTKTGLWLHGPVGNGKTHIAAAIVNECLERGTPAVFTTGVRLLERIRGSYERDGSTRDGARDILAVYADVEVLVLDDLGKERFTAWTAERLYDLVNRRYENNLAAIVTSNLSPPQLAEHWRSKDMDPTLGAALVRRLAEMTGEAMSL